MGYKPTKKYPQETEIAGEVKGADELLKYAEKMVRLYRTKSVCGLRSQIFRQIAQKFCRHTVVCQKISVQDDGIICKQDVRVSLCGIALRKTKKQKIIHQKRNVNDLLRFTLYQLPLSDTP